MVIAAKWKTQQVPRKDEWIGKLNEYLLMAKLTAAIRNQTNQNLKEQWKCYEEYMEKHCSKKEVLICLE